MCLRQIVVVVVVFVVVVVVRMGWGNGKPSRITSALALTYSKEASR